MKLKTLFPSLPLLLISTLTCCCSVYEPMPPAPKPGRTVIVYMAADNNLSGYSYNNIRDMVWGAEDDNLGNGKLLVYHDSASESPRLINIRKGEDGGIVEDTVRIYESRNSVDVAVMRSVFSDIMGDAAFRSDSYGLVLWSHGTAWLPSDIKNYLRSYGQDKNSYMEIYELKEALSGYKFDFIIFDDCYMANIEVACTLAGNTGYILASPTEVLAPGLPYQYIIKYMFEDGDIASSLSKIGDTFYSYYEGQMAGSQYPKSASTTLVRTAGIEDLAAICREILKGREEDIFNLPLENIQLIERLGFSHHSLFDFADFIKQLATPDQYARFEEALKKVVVHMKTTDIAYYSREGGIGGITIDRERFCGISSYVPQRDLPPLNDWYSQLDWYKLVYK
ncbi:MAG: hypothetical protein LBI58_04070 [Tannerellaceae bacterium]|jgi:hypothetical protein|nr:hypothetical protein [Tannerellaceae bacterium]